MGLRILTDTKATPAARDGAGRAHDGRDARPRWSLRVSLLEQCSHACPYCLPGTVVAPTEKARWLTPDEHLRLGRLFLSRGVVKVRFTGGEPLLRPDVVDVVAAYKEAGADLDLALTTNGHRLAQMVAPLARAGLRRATVHLDTLREDRYPGLMGPSRVTDIVAAAVHARTLLADVKLNVVVQRGKNDDELSAFLAFSRAHEMQVRFIELMNTGSAADYVREVFVPGREIVQRLGGTPLPRAHASDPAALFRAADGTVFGVIASDTEPFCADCDRLRLTADGRLRGCLYESGGVPLGAALRSGASDRTLQALLDAGIGAKSSHHPLHAPHRAPFSMADIGG